MKDHEEWARAASDPTVRAVVKGGRRLSFNAMVVVGDENGRVAWGYGKANEVPPAVEKAAKDAHKQMNRVGLQGGTIPHTVIGKFGTATRALDAGRSRHRRDRGRSGAGRGGSRGNQGCT